MELKDIQLTNADKRILAQCWRRMRKEHDPVEELPEEVVYLSFGCCDCGLDENDEGFVRITMGGKRRYIFEQSETFAPTKPKLTISKAVDAAEEAELLHWADGE